MEEKLNSWTKHLNKMHKGMEAIETQMSVITSSILKRKCPRCRDYGLYQPHGKDHDMEICDCEIGQMRQEQALKEAKKKESIESQMDDDSDAEIIRFGKED